MTSAVFLIPNDFRMYANAVAEGLGWGPNNYSIPLSFTGVPPATHWGCHREVSPGFFEVYNNPPDDFSAMLRTQVHSDFKESTDTEGHFNQIIESLGLKRILQVPLG